jgi:hypothetical protein
MHPPTKNLVAHATPATVAAAPLINWFTAHVDSGDGFASCTLCPQNSTAVYGTMCSAYPTFDLIRTYSTSLCMQTTSA